MRRHRAGKSENEDERPHSHFDAKGAGMCDGRARWELQLFSAAGSPVIYLWFLTYIRSISPDLGLHGIPTTCINIGEVQAAFSMAAVFPIVRALRPFNNRHQGSLAHQERRGHPHSHRGRPSTTKQSACRLCECGPTSHYCRWSLLTASHG